MPLVERGTSYLRALKLSAAIAGAAAVVVFVSYRTIIGPRLSFDPRIESFVFERDALSEEFGPVPVDDLFSEANVERYRAGDGFSALFRIHHDPGLGGETSEVRCGLEAWASFAETSNPARRALIERRKAEFRECAAEFIRKLSVPRSLEIGVDDTDGVDAGLAEFVRRTLSDEEVTTDRIFETTRIDEVRLVFFRLSGIEAYDQRLYILEADASREEIERAWEEGLNGWLLAERAPGDRTSIARGVFNALSRHPSIPRREIHVFSDGMENSPEVTSFYEIVRNPIDTVELDAEMSELIRCPDTVPAAFAMTWHFVPLDLPFYYRIRDYWEHVLTEVCGLPAVAVLY